MDHFGPNGPELIHDFGTTSILEIGGSLRRLVIHLHLLVRWVHHGVHPNQHPLENSLGILVRLHTLDPQVVYGFGHQYFLQSEQ